MACKIETVVVANNATRGNGNENPYRTITEVYMPDGTLIATNDALSFSIEKIRERWGKLAFGSDINELITALITSH